MTPDPSSLWRRIRHPAPAACAAILFAVNVWICHDLFTTEFLAHMGSIESTHIALGRWVAEHPFDLTWFPLWYGGVPFLNTYPPIGPATTALLSTVLGLSPALAYHANTAAYYCLGPVLLFLLAYVVTRAVWPSFLAALVYSVFSPTVLVTPEVARDMGGVGGPRRFQALVLWGEGPHIISLTLIPLAIAALHWAIEKPNLKRIWLAAMAVALVPLTNWIGTVGLAAAVFAYLLATIGRSWRRTLGLSAIIGVLAYAMASPWIPPSSIVDFQRNAQNAMGQFAMGAPQIGLWGILLVLTLLCLAAARKLRFPPILQFGLVYFLLMAGVTISRTRFGVYALPQPERFHLEAEIGAVLFGAFAVYYAVRRLRPDAVAAVTAAACVAVALQAVNYRSYARNWIRPVDISTTIEYQVANWARKYLPGERVFAEGSVRFWLNVFSDNPQVGGGSDQAMVNMELPHLKYAVPFTEGNGEETSWLLKAMGVSAIVVGGPNSRDSYRDYHDPGKFEGVFPELWRDGDDIIYGVPGRAASLAHVILPEHVVEQRPPALDRPVELLPYINAIEDRSLPFAELVWRSFHEAVITADMNPPQVLSVQVAYHPSWRATANGAPAAIRRDGLGQMIVEPDCGGPCEIRLLYDPGAERHVTSAAAGLAFLVPLLILLRRRVRGRANLSGTT